MGYALPRLRSDWWGLPCWVLTQLLQLSAARLPDSGCTQLAVVPVVIAGCRSVLVTVHISLQVLGACLVSVCKQEQSCTCVAVGQQQQEQRVGSITLLCVRQRGSKQSHWLSCMLHLVKGLKHSPAARIQRLRSPSTKSTKSLNTGVFSMVLHVMGQAHWHHSKRWCWAKRGRRASVTLSVCHFSILNAQGNSNESGHLELV